MSVRILPAKRWTSEWWLQLLLCVVWAKSLIGFFRGVLLKIPVIGEFTDQIELLIYCIPLVCALPSIIRKLQFFDFLFYLAWVCYLLVSYNIAVDTTKIEESSVNFLFSILPLYFIGRLIDYPKVEKAFTLISIVCIIGNIFYMGIYVRNGLSSAEFTTDNMGASYAILPYLLILIASIFKKFSYPKLALAIFTIIFMVSLGTRGPIVCIFAFVFLMVMFNTQAKRKFVLLCAIAIIGVLIFAYLEYIVHFLIGIFHDLHLSTRILDKYLTGEMSDDSGRSDLQNALWNLLNNGSHPIGYGLFSSWSYIDTYAHNFILDIFFSFGYYLGSLLLVGFSYIFIKAVSLTRSTNRAFLFVLFCSSFVKLCLSASFVFEPYLFFLIGYCVSIIRKKVKYSGSI